MTAKIAGTALDGIVALRVTDRGEAARWVRANLLAAAHVHRRHSSLRSGHIAYVERCVVIFR